MNARSLVFGSAAVFVLTVLATPVNITAQQNAAPATHFTYAKDVAPIMQRSCQTCHRPGTNAPMSLLTYEDARPWAKAIASKVADVNNVSASTFAGSIIAALFLRRFVDPRQDWLHVDLYAWNGKDRPGRPVGAEPQAVRALYALIAERYALGR